MSVPAGSGPAMPLRFTLSAEPRRQAPGARHAGLIAREAASPAPGRPAMRGAR